MQLKRREGTRSAPKMCIQEPKRTQKPIHRTNSNKEFSGQFEGTTGSLPIKTRVLRLIAPESSPERSAKSLSHSFFEVPFLSQCNTQNKFPGVLRDCVDIPYA